MPLPKGWLQYSAVGRPILETRIVACKVPLREAILRHQLPRKDWFTPDILMDMMPNVKCIIDLTATTKYYDSSVFLGRGIQYVKIFCKGHGTVPSAQVVERFLQAMDEFLNDDRSQGQFIMVHCTHGLNRTGYLICRYLMERRGMDPNSAIKAFNEARGHFIERAEYIEDLMKIAAQPGALSIERQPHWQGNSGNCEPRRVSSSYERQTAHCHRRADVGQRPIDVDVFGTNTRPRDPHWIPRQDRRPRWETGVFQRSWSDAAPYRFDSSRPQQNTHSGRGNHWSLTNLDYRSSSYDPRHRYNY